MASNRHGKVTREAYQVLLSGMQVADLETRVVHMERFYRYPITEPEARKDAVNDPDTKDRHIYGITVDSIRKCLLGMDWDIYSQHCQILRWDPVDY